ncbi:hypothetical protein BJ878DRAFT_539567 [Calycina marina]|uniref:Uncharacterized protein n=1 Tax=Calycina marina TaxID=1763456 RepID=A0A9P7Z826_9HELO|nr:hypothetical protein BJ878DRAFT_539567 [Calycina marina]
MARPYKTDFEKEIQSPMSPVAGGGSNTPISYKVDVNRKKTNKWANAKPVTYDDWDDDDEYNDESAPPSKPTGLKQQGQSLAAGKKNYGDLPPAQETGARANSFDADDEVRNFSSGAATSPPITATAPGPVTRFSQMAVPQSRTASGPPALSVTTQMPLPQAATGMRKASAPMPPISQEYSAPVGRINPSETAATASLVSLADSRTSSDYQARRDYSPSAVPSPLRPAGAAVTSSPQTSDPPTARFPARKSSLSQSRGPDISDVTRAHQEAVTASHATQPKSLPFVRPADIYKRRMEEERERQSLDSSRPSVDSVRSNKVNEKPEAMSDVPGSSDRRDESTDSSRLRLEPVQERKSEYGFERDNGDQNTPRAPGLTFQPPLSEADKDEAGDIRSNPTSPQLPNLNRMSGFGMDLFTKSKQNIYAEPIREETTETPTGTALDTRLEPMPATNSDQSFSPGFQTVVNQAFEKKRNDSSPPPASVSQSNGAVQIGRERTGTVGISPVMKSLPAVPSLDSRMDDARPSNAATIESDVRDNIPQVNKPIPSQQVSGISNTQEQPAFLGGNIAKSNAGDSDEPLQPPRPIVERDQSFRPHLPGGWESYATTPGRESPVASVQLASDASSMARSGSPPSLKVHKESELAPTAAEHFSEVGIPVTGAALTKSKKSRENSPAKNAPSSGPAQSNDRFPTPDHSMAPGGSLYSHTALDPRLLSKPEQTVQAKQTRPEIISEPSFDSEAAPISLPRNTPKVVNDNPEYFPAYDTAPKKSLTEGASGNPTHEQPEPSMSSTAQDSNDQFHDEISRGLSPQPAIQRTDSLGVESPEEKSSNQTRISSYLPSEYDNYWASTAEGVTPAAVVTAPAENFDNQTLQTTNPTYTLTPVAMDTPLPADRDLTPEPLSPRKHEHIIEPISQSHRSSWEAKSEHQSATPVYSEPVVNTDEVGKDHSHEGARVESQPIHTPVPKPSGYEGLKSHSTTPTPESQPQHVTGTDATLVGGGLALGVAAAAAAYQHSSEPPSDPQRRLSLAEEKNPRVSSYPVSPTPPEDEHPSRCSQPNCSQIDIAALLPSTVSNVSAPSGPSVPSSIVTNSPTHAQHQPPVAILPFKDIVALQSPQQRSQKFDETRKTFAAMDSGLTSWISSLQSQYPEHRDTTGSFGRPTLDQSKFGRSPTGATPQLQQPYYQQYLNASSPTTPGNQSLRPGPSTSVGSQHGFHPPASQMTQQVQAKSKELLHTAGVFSGKAGKVGKGLLARGKNKLRGAGGGDKVD